MAAKETKEDLNVDARDVDNVSDSNSMDENNADTMEEHARLVPAFTSSRRDKEKTHWMFKHLIQVQCYDAVSESVKMQMETWEMKDFENDILVRGPCRKLGTRNSGAEPEDFEIAKSFTKDGLKTLVSKLASRRREKEAKRGCQGETKLT